MLKKPVMHMLVLRCDKCKERFQIEANPKEDKYKCPHCEKIVEYECHRTGPVAGPSEVK